MTPPHLAHVDIHGLASSVRQQFFPFHLQPAAPGAFQARTSFRRGPGLGIGAVTIDPHVATISRSNQEAMRSGMVKMLWIEEGEAQFEQGDWTWALRPGQWVMYDVDRPYRFLSSTRMSFITVVCDRTLLGAPASGKPTPQLTDDIARLSLLSVQAALASGMTLSRRVVDTLAYGFGQCLHGGPPVPLDPQAVARHADLQARLVHRARSHIERHLHDPALCPDMVANALCVSRRTLYAAFAAMKDAPARAIQEARLRHANQLLTAREARGINLTTLALHLGFSDAAHFSRTYKQRFGESPSATRARG